MKPDKRAVALRVKQKVRRIAYDSGEEITKTTLTPAQKRVIEQLGTGVVHFDEIKMSTRAILLNKGIITIEGSGMAVLTEYGKRVARQLEVWRSEEIST